ncbi:MAG: glycosyl hydrolase [Polaribacter sp.]|uniref:glycosyl hydrolase n=1 Tax=Polaribacter sp. TaxID=1920175 RepID=UPI003BAEC0BE
MKFHFTLFFIITFSATIFSQTYTWSGAANDNNFFNEANWVDSNTGLAPTGNPINGGTAINRVMIVSNVTSTITGTSEINLGTTGSLSITNATIAANAIRGGTININENGYLNLEIATAFKAPATINLNSGIGWVRTKLIAPSVVQSTHLGQFKINSIAASYPSNIRLDNYYFGGTVIRSNLASTSPATLYNQVNLGGTSVSLAIDVIHSGNGITNMNNKTSSFLLRKGFMMTIADDEAGIGKSKNYIASEKDLIVNELPTNLKDKVSFVRIIPWNWVSKKGIGSNTLISGLDNTWFYRWSNDGLSTIEVENPPMAWGAGGADDDADITLYKQKYKTTHVMGFNEPDDCGAQSGQFRNLCDEDVAVGYYRNLMKTGLRLVSPAGREEAPTGWLQNFYDKATAQDIRIDVIAVHWYDWGNNPAVNTNPTAQQVFDRFKTYLTSVYNRFGKPIWITEFNANPNRSNAINLAFMQLALPYLETLDYVERYAWFEPSSDVADFYDTSNNVTNVGTFYKNQVSTPSISENTITANNNIDVNYSKNPTLNHTILTNGNFDTGDLRAWLGANNQVLMDNDGATNLTTNYRFENVAQINEGAGSLYQILEVAPNVSYTVSFDYKWVSGAGTYNQIARVYKDLTGTNSIGSVTLSTIPGVWYTATFNFTAPTNVFKARVFFNKASGNNPLRINNVRVHLNPNKTWSGAINNDWNTSGNWTENAVPLTTDVVFIPRDLTNYPTVSGDLTVSQLVIDSSASFITSGTTNGGVTGGTTYFAELNDENWHLVSSPLATQVMNQNWVAAAGIATGGNNHIAIGSYQNGVADTDDDGPGPDTATGPWTYFKSTDANSNFNNGQGYTMKKLSKGIFIFNGNLASYPRTINISQGAATHWNLIGNTATSYLDVNQFLTTNTTPLKDAYEAVFVWNADTENYDALTDGFIHPGQAFFVNSNVANTSVSITAAMLSHQRNQVFYKSESVPSPQIVLNFTDGTNNKQTKINYIDGKTTGLDPRFDIGLFDGVASDFKIYTHLISQNEGIPFMKQALPNAGFENMVVPIGIKAKAGKELIFSLEAANFPEGIFVYLEDRFTNSVTRLNEANANYKVTFTENFDTSGRFFLHTKSSGVLSTEDVNLQHISIYKTSNATLRIVGLTEGNANVTLFSVLGKQVLKTNFQAKTISEIDLPKLAKGVYFVKLQHEDVSITKKIILE